MKSPQAKREQAVLSLTRNGMPPRMIAKRLGLKVGDVRAILGRLAA
jgi:DNA-binding NarL/FixJ family response regulator